MTAPWTSLPRVRLTELPTPLHRLDRFGDAIGAEVWIKRDDAGPVGTAGNKIRKLEYTLAEAQNLGADAILIIGAQQSNAARATASACAQLGLRCVLVLAGDEPETPSGNLLLDTLFGAEVHFAGTTDWIELWQASQRVADTLREEGSTPYALPAGSSSALGAVGFAAAWAELRDQLAERGVDARTLFHAASSGGTLAGLVVGKAIDGGAGPELHPIGVDAHITPDVPGLARGALELLGMAGTAVDDVPVDLSFVGEGYGIPSPEGVEAIRLLARTEGIVCDPIYSGKALAAVVAAEHAGPCVFWHTGGYQAVFAPHVGAALISR